MEWEGIGHSFRPDRVRSSRLSWPMYPFYAWHEWYVAHMRHLTKLSHINLFMNVSSSFKTNSDISLWIKKNLIYEKFRSVLV